MKKIAKRVAIAIGAAVLLLLVIDYLIDVERKGRDTRFAQELAKELEELEKISGRLQLQDMTEFDWDKVCIFSPYMRKEDFERNSTNSISYIKWWSFGLDMMSPEGQWTLIFIDETGLVDVRKIWASVAYLDFNKLAKRCWLSSDELIVRKTDYSTHNDVYYYFEFLEK